MSGDGNDYDFDRYKAANERGYQQGYRYGAEDERKAGEWHIPAVRPKHGENIIAVVLPYSWRTRRYCRKNGLKYLKVSGVFASGDGLAADIGDDPGEWTDMFLPDAHTMLTWDWAVKLWISAELPEWFDMREDDNDG